MHESLPVYQLICLGVPCPLLQISLFLDVLKCLCSDQTQDQFVNEVRTGCSSPNGPQGAAVRRGRAELWRILRGTPLTLSERLYCPGLPDPHFPLV